MPLPRPRLASRPRQGRRRGGTSGFTLVELLVTIFIMAILSLMSWQGIDGMVRVQEATRSRADQIIGLQAGLAQWTVDLDAVQETQIVNAIDYDGSVLRLTRRDVVTAQGLRVVAWVRRNPQGQWTRWQSPPVRNREQLLEQWERAAVWGRNPVSADSRFEAVLGSIDQWEIFYYRGDAWTNPLSTAVAAAPGAAGGSGIPGVTGVPGVAAGALTAVPDGVRLVLSLSGQQTLSGTLVRDWVRPTAGGSKSL